MKVCIKCNKKWQEEFNICPICGSDLVQEKQKNPSVSVGDANAISGGVHNTDDHSVKNDNSSSDSHNTTNSHNTTINNYGTPFTHTEKKISPEEILRERKLKYRECCKKVLSDGILTQEDRNLLEEQRIQLDLSAEVASSIFREVSDSHQRNVMSMGTVQRIQFNNLKRAVEGNMESNVKREMPKIKVIANKFQEEELQYLYHMVLAALYPEKCVEAYQNRQEDKYWLTFWVYVSLHKLGDVQNAETVLIDLGKWQGLMPDENLVVLAALGSLIDGDMDVASEMYMQAVNGEHSPLLTPMVEVLSSIINFNPNDSDILASLTKHKFYVDNFLNKIYQNEIEKLHKAEEEKQRKAEEERIRKEELKRQKEEAERRRVEEEERQRKEEERRKAEEAERKRKEEAEQKRKMEEARKQAEEKEAARKAEEERQKLEVERQRLEQERKQLETEKRAIEEQRRKVEAERKQKELIEAEEKAIKKAQEEARRAAAMEEARKKAEEELRKRKENEDRWRREAEEQRRMLEERKRLEAEIKRKQEEERKRKAEEAERIASHPRFCRKCGNALKPGALFCNKCGAKI